MDKPLQAYPGREIRSETTSTPQPHPIVSEQLLRLQPHIWPDCQECSGMDIPAERDQEKDPFDHHLQLEQRRSLSTTFNHNDRNDRNDDMNDNAANTDINHSEEEERKGGEKEEEEITSTPFQVPSDISRIWSASTSSTTVAYSNEARNTLDVAARASSIGTRTETRMRTRTRTRAARRVVVPESGVFPSVLFPSSSTLEEQEWDSNKLDTEVASGSVLRPGRSLAIVTSFKEGQTEEDMSMTDRTATRAFRTHSRTHPSTSEVAHSEHEHASSSAHGSLSALQMQLTVSPTRASTATPSTPTTTNMTMTPTSSSPSFSSSSSSPFFSSTTATTPTSSTSPSEPKADAATPLVDQDCAICLDSILPRNHAKATLACRHEFHLSCISMAFSMGKEMVCPLCRYLHKDQPFMCLESDAKPLRTLLTSSSTTSTTASSGTTTVSPRGMNGRNRHNSIHLQQHLSNLVQHQRHHQRHRRDNSTSSQDNTTPPSTSPATSPRASTVLSSIPFFGSTSTSSAFHGRPVSSQLYNYNRRNSSSPRDAYPSTSPFSIPHGHYINMTTWFMLYVVPFSVAILFLAFLLGRAETLWSRVSCLVGSVICYMICWAIAVACLLSQEETTTAFFSPPVQHVSYPQQQIQGFPIEYEIEPDTMTMGQGATHPAALSSYEDNVSAEESWHSPTFLAPYYPTPPMTSPPAPQVRRLSPAATLVQLATSSFSSAAGAAAHLLSFSQGWTTSRYAQDLQNRVMDLAEVLDDYSESFGEW